MRRNTLRYCALRDLEWIERTEGGEVRYRAEPKTGLLRRFGVWLLALLPIQWLL